MPLSTSYTVYDLVRKLCRTPKLKNPYHTQSDIWNAYLQHGIALLIGKILQSMDFTVSKPLSLRQQHI